MNCLSPLASRRVSIIYVIISLTFYRSASNRNVSIFNWFGNTWQGHVMAKNLCIAFIFHSLQTLQTLTVYIHFLNLNVKISHNCSFSYVFGSVRPWKYCYFMKCSWLHWDWNSNLASVHKRLALYWRFPLECRPQNSNPAVIQSGLERLIMHCTTGRVSPPFFRTCMIDAPNRCRICMAIVMHCE